MLAELGDGSRNLEPVRNINDFLKKFHQTTSFVTKEWLEEELESAELFASFERLYSAGKENPLRLDLSEKGELTHYTNPIQIIQHKVTDFFVSDADPNELYVGATVWAELEVEVEYYPWADVYDRRVAYSPPKCECVYPEVEMDVQLDVVGEEVASIEVVKMNRS